MKCKAKLKKNKNKKCKKNAVIKGLCIPHYIMNPPNRCRDCKKLTSYGAVRCRNCYDDYRKK